jgi:hypothetical protein
VDAPDVGLGEHARRVVACEVAARDLRVNSEGMVTGDGFVECGKPVRVKHLPAQSLARVAVAHHWQYSALMHWSSNSKTFDNPHMSARALSMAAFLGSTTASNAFVTFVLEQVP